MEYLTAILSLALLGFVAGWPFSESENLHQQIKSEETRESVHSQFPHESSEFDFAPIDLSKLKHTTDGSAAKIRVEAFGHMVELHLIPSTQVLINQDTLVYLVNRDNLKPGGFNYVKFDGNTTHRKIVLEDRTNQASIILRQSVDGKNTISGYIESKNWTIKPVPTRFQSQLNTEYRKSVNDNSSEAHESNLVYHVVYKNRMKTVEPDYLTVPDHLIAAMQNNVKQSHQNVPSVVYPQILLVIDYPIYDRFQKDIYNLLEYLVLFWNVVDTRFRSLDNPEVRLNIAGIIVATEPNVNLFSNSSEINTEGSIILDTLGQYFGSNETPFSGDSYDIIFAMVPFIVTSCGQDKLQPCGNVNGITYLRAACITDSLSSRRRYSLAVIRDVGIYDTDSAAHELAHLFGAEHDGPENPNCPVASGHIMAEPYFHSTNASQWSSCSLESMKNFFHSPLATCLYNLPNKTMLPNYAWPLLPGNVFSLDEQCHEILIGSSFSGVLKDVCFKLICDHPTEGRVEYADIPALDGSPCGDDRICYNGKCVHGDDAI